MRKLLLLTFLSGLLNAQVVYTAPVPPQGAKPATLTVTANSLVCSLAGDAVPATNITITCNIGTTKLGTFVLPVISGAAYTFQYNFGTTSAVTVIMNNLTPPIQVTAAVNGSTAQGGTF